MDVGGRPGSLSGDRFLRGELFASTRMQDQDRPRWTQERIARGVEICHGESGKRTVDNGSRRGRLEDVGEKSWW